MKIGTGSVPIFIYAKPEVVTSDTPQGLICQYCPV